MPRAIAEKLQFDDAAYAFIDSKGKAGANTGLVHEHMRAHGWNVYPHVTAHALNRMRKEGRLTRWREGNTQVWVTTYQQEQANATVVEETIAPVPVVPDLKIGIVKSTGHLRLVWKGLSIEIGVLEE